VAREQQRRAKGEDVTARQLEAELEKVHQAREAAWQGEAGLREHLAAQGTELAQMRTRSEALAASVEALEAASTMKKPRTRKRGG
jgi:BMFP domain-containing protein YqiC